MNQLSFHQHSKPKSALHNGSLGKTSQFASSQVDAKKAALHERASTCSDSNQTIRYLTEYLNQLVLDNCKLKTDLSNREKEASWLQQELLRKEEDVELLKESKLQIEQSVKKICLYNESYLQELKRKDSEIDHLRRLVVEAPHKPCYNQDSYDTEDIAGKDKYNELREAMTDRKSTNISAFTNCTVLESAKKYVAYSLSCIPSNTDQADPYNKSIVTRKL